MDRAIVITTIFRPTGAARQFAAIPGWQLIVAGDRKTPPDWSVPGATYLSAGEQEASRYRITRLLPWNHYCRKMIGYLHAIERGATVIAESDDDNLPKPGWEFPPFDGEFPVAEDGLGFLNVYRLYTGMRIWPRGFPLELLTSAGSLPRRETLCPASVRVGVWQGLADGNPDVDAIYRLTDDTPCEFDDGPPVVLGRGTACPFNSQNTAFRREVFPLLYLPAHVTFRFTDILRGLVAQPILWAAGWRLGFTRATVVQERNPHNYLDDFRSEIPCYLHAAKVIDVVGSIVRGEASIADNLRSAYRALAGAGIVPDAELPLLDAWLEDVAG